MSLRARVLAGIALIALVLSAVLVVVNKTTEANLLRQVDTQLQASVRPVRDYSTGFRSRPGDDHGDDDDRRLTSLFIGYVSGDDVATLVAPNVGGVTSLPDIDGNAATDAARAGQPFTVGSDGTGRYRALAYTDDREGAVIVLALPIDSVDHAVRSLVTVEVFGALVIAAVLALVAWWVIHLGVRPVKRMTSTATAIAAGDLSHRVPAADPRTEAGELGAALNQMLANIEAAFDDRTKAVQNLRQFVADASHELRTPVATIRGYAELYRSGGLDERASLDDAMRRTEQEAIRMGSLVDDLLHLARLDQGRPVEREPVDLAVLAADAARDAHAVDPSRAVTTAGEGSLVVEGDESRLRQVLANVVGNALVHTPPGTAIEIRTSREDGSAVIAVTDQGPGMNDDVAARAFERFYRADPARSRHKGGSGLGLAIVEATVKAHGGTTVLRTAPGAGTSVEIQLPLTPSE